RVGPRRQEHVPHLARPGPATGTPESRRADRGVPAVAAGSGLRSAAAGSHVSTATRRGCRRRATSQILSAGAGGPTLLQAMEDPELFGRWFSGLSWRAWRGGLGALGGWVGPGAEGGW